MRLHDLFEHKTSGYATDIDAFDTLYNHEATHYRNSGEDYTEKLKNDFDDGVPVYTKPPRAPEHRIFKTSPDAGDNQSSGYRGREHLRRRVGHNYDPKVKRHVSQYVFFTGDDPNIDNRTHNQMNK